MRYPYKCPVCFGEQIAEYSTGKAKCRSCEGTGIVWSPEDGTVSVFSTPQQVSMEQVNVFNPLAICTCPPEIREGRPYVGDNFCPRHTTKYEIT